MKYRFASFWPGISCFVLFASVATGVACSSSSDSGSSAIGDGGGGGGGDGGSTSTDGAGGGTGTYWFTTYDDYKVGIGDLDGNASFTDTLTEKPLKVILGGGSAWVLTEKGNVVRYDLGSHQKVATIPAAKDPGTLVYAGNAIWVTENNNGGTCSPTTPTNGLVRIDPATNMVTSTTGLAADAQSQCDRFDGMVTDGTTIYVLITNDFGVVRIDPSSATPATTAKTLLGHLGDGGLGGYGAGYITVSGNALWVHDTVAKTLLKLDKTSLAVSSTTPLMAGFNGEHMVASNDALYLEQPYSDQADSLVLRIDANAPATQVTFPWLKSSPDSLTIHNGLLYATYTESLDAEIVSYDLTSLAEVKRVQNLVYPSTIAFTD